MKIQLPDFIIADLYKNSIVLTDDLQKKNLNSAETKVTETYVEAKQNINEPDEKKWYLGNNARQVIIIVNDENNMYLSDELLQLLTTILSACKLTLEDVAIINNAKNNLAYQQLKQSLQPAYCFLFNVSTAAIQLSFTIPQYQVQQYDNCTFLLAPSLNLMNGKTPEAKSEKTKLWICLKNIFNRQ